MARTVKTCDVQTATRPMQTARHSMQQCLLCCTLVLRVAMPHATFKATTLPSRNPRGEVSHDVQHTRMGTHGIRHVA